MNKNDFSPQRVIDLFSSLDVIKINNEESPEKCIWIFKTEDMEGGNMKIKSFLFIAILIISVVAIHCGRSQSPFSPETGSNAALLNGTVILSGTSTAGFGAIQIGVKGTSHYTTPDKDGNFRIDNLPLGNVVIEVAVESDLSEIQIDNVKSGEEIRIRVEVQDKNQVVLAHMERHHRSNGLLQVQIQPKKWNLNWGESEDEVIAKISGDDYDQIVSGSVKLVGPDDDKIGSYEEDVGGTYFIAKFRQSEAIGIINDPVPGMDYDIRVEYVLGGETLYLQDTIEIVGKMPRDSEELSIQVNPAKWNTNWDKSSGTVMVKFWGDGYDQIDPAAVMMIGPDDPDGPDDVDVIYPVASNLTEDQLIVKFAKKDALSIIPEPNPGDKHVIIITDDLDGLGAFSFEYGIEIVGPKK